MDPETETREAQILAYLQGDMRAEDRAAFEAEVARDPALQAELIALQTAGQVMAEAVEPDIRARAQARLNTSLDREAPRAANDNWPLRAMLLQAAAVALASVLLWQFVISPRVITAPGLFQPVSEASAGAVLQVVFEGEAAMQDVTALLRSVDARIFDGPGAVGLYRIRFDSDAARAEAIAVLSSSGLVSEYYVE